MAVASSWMQLSRGERIGKQSLLWAFSPEYQCCLLSARQIKRKYYAGCGREPVKALARQTRRRRFTGTNGGSLCRYESLPRATISLWITPNALSTYCLVSKTLLVTFF